MITGQGRHHLNVFRWFGAVRGSNFLAKSGFERPVVSLDEGIKPNARAPVGEGDDRDVADIGILSNKVDQDRCVVDQSPAAAFPIGEIEQAAGDGAVDLLAGRKPEACNKRLAGQDLALFRRQRGRA